MREQKTLLKAHYLKNALSGNCEKLGERCGDAAVHLFIRRLIDCIGTPENDKYTYVHRKAIEVHQQDSYAGENATSIFMDALRDSMIGLVRTDKVAAGKCVVTLLSSAYPSVGRVGIYICDKYFGSFGNFFEEQFQDYWFIKAEYWHEIFWLIKNNYENFSDSLKKRFLKMVELLPGDWDEEDERTADAKEYHRRDLLGAAVGQRDKAIDEWYSQLEKKIGPVRNHVDFQSYSSSGWIGSTSPKTSEQLLTMSDEELDVFFRTFLPDPSVWEGPSYHGVAMSLQEAVKVSEDGFKSKYNLFREIHPAYQHGLLSGVKERLALASSSFDWPAIVALIQAIRQRPDNQAIGSSSHGFLEPNSEWVLTDISDLLKAGFQSEAHPIPSQLEIECLEIVLGLLKQSVPSDTSDTKDAVSKMINSRYGKALEASLVGALALARRKKTGTTSIDVWQMLFPTYSDALVESERGSNLEFATFAGLYCTNLHYLSPTWVEENFHRLFSLKNSPAWLCAAQGFSYQTHIYPWLYTLLNKGGHFRRMISEESLKDEVQERAMQFLGLAYLNDELEQLSDTEQDSGVLATVIEELNDAALSHLCWFFWTLRNGSSNSNNGRKIIRFWKKLDATISTSNEQHLELLSSLTSLAVFIDVLDESTTTLLLNSAIHSNLRFNTHTLLSELRRLSAFSPKEVSLIFDEVTNRFLPDFEQEDVVTIVENISRNGHADIARSICNKYAIKGINFLNDVFERIRAGNLSS